MTRTDIYKASKSIFPSLPDEETFAMDMQDTEKANRAFQSALNNKDKYEEMGVTLPETVEEFQTIVTTDPKKKSTDTGSNGSQKTQQSSGSKTAQSSQQGPRVFQPQRVFNSAEEINNYFGYLDQYKNDPKAQKEKQWFEQNYPTISEQFWNQGGKPLTIQGPVYEDQKKPSFEYDPGTLPKLQQKSTINNADLKDKSIGESSTDEYTIDPKTGKKIWKRLTDEELLGDVIENTQQKQDVMQIPVNIQQVAVDSEKKAKREEEAAKTKGMTFQQIEEQYKQDLEEIDKKELYRKNYDFIESMIDNQFGTRSNDIDFKKLNVLNKSEVENAYSLLEQDYLEYLQKTDPQEYQRVNNEITAIKGKKSDERSLGEREVLENYRVQAMKMHNLLNGYVMTKLEKDYDIKGFYSGINVINSQVEAIDKQLEEMNIDPSGRGVTQPMMDKYNELVQKRNKLVSQVASLAEKTGVTPEIQAKYEDALGRYTDSKITTSQLRSLDSEVMNQKEENMIAAKKRFDEAMSGDYSIVGEFARGYAGTVGKSFVDFIGRTWDIAGEAWGDTDYDIFDQMNNFVKGYTLQQQETFGTAQDMAFIGEPKKYEDLPLIYRLNNLTSSGLASISLAASGSLATGAIGLGSTVGGGLLMMGSSLADNYEEALSMSYSGQEAAEYASSIAAAEYMIESFFPDFNLFKIPQARNTYFQALKKTSSIKEALAITFEQLPQSLKYQAKRSADNLVKEGFVEEAGAQALTDLIKTGFNEQNKDKGQFETFQSQDYVDAVLGGWLGAEGARVVGRLAKPFMPHEESAFYQAAINPQILQLAQSNEVEFPDEVQEIIDEFAVINNAMKSKPGWDNMTDDEKAHIVSEVRRMKYLESKNKETGIDDPGTKEEISNIKAAVEQYIDQARNNPKFKLPQYALQEPSSEEVLPRQQGETTETGGQPQGMGPSVQGQEVAQEGQEVSQEGVKPELENNPELIEQRRIETQSQIERTDLFDGVGDFSSELGGSDKAAVPTNRQKINEIEFVQYSHPETGSLDVIVTGTSDNDFVGFYRVYENGKPTNKWSSKFENQSRNKENFKTMISNAQDMLPEGHEYMEKTSISTDGLRVWNQQLDRGYELQYDENGKLKTNLVAINGDAIVNELGIPVNKGDFDNIRVSNKEDFEKVKKVLLPYLEKFGLDESNIRWLTGTVKIDLPVLLKSSKKQEVTQEGVKKEDVVNQPFGELPENTEDFTGIGAGYLKNNLWASKQLGKDSKTSLLGNIKNEVLNKGKKAFLYFIDPKLSEGQLDTENKYNTKLNDKINAQGNKTLTGAENAAIENEVGAELAKEGVKGELVSDEKDGTYRIFDTKNTELLGYIEATPELIEKISDPNITEEQAKQILFDEAGVKMGDNVLIHANENDLSKYKTQKDVESEDYVGKLEEAKKQKPEKFWSVSTPPVGDVKGGTLIKVKGGEAIVDKTGEIRGLYKYPDTEERGVGDQLVKKGIEAGGVKLDNFALDNLMDIYQRNGFKVVSRLPFSEKDAPEGWKKKEHGTPDVVAMIYDPENKLDIEEKQFTKDQYDEALAYRDSFVDAQKEAYGESSEPQFDKEELSSEYLNTIEKAGLNPEGVAAWKEKNKVNQKQKPVPIVKEAAEKLFEGEITSEQFRQVVKENQPIIPFTKVPDLPTLQDVVGSLKSNQVETGVVGINKEFKDGDDVATRLDIPAYENYDTWVVSIHDGKNEGKALGYGQTAVLKDVNFKSFAGPALRIASGKQSKSTIARMFGKWVNEDPTSVHERAKKLLNDPEWVQVGMNPYRHSGFYDKKTGNPVVSSEEVIQVGALVLAKNPVMTTWDDPMFATKNLKGEKIFFDKNVESDSSDPYTYNEETLVNEMNDSGILNPEIDLETGLDEVGDLDVESIKGRNNLSSNPDVISIVDYNGKPIMLTISDELRVGNVNNPINGKLINKLFGGLLFPWSKGNEGYAWAYTSEKAARDVLAVAREIYKSNKSLYPDGMIPVAVVKMGKDAMVSNEAVLRQIIQNLEDGKIPAKNKAKAYDLLKQRIKDDYEKLKEKSKTKDGLSASEKASLKGHSDVIALFNKAKDFDSFLKKSNLLNIGTRPIVIKKITTGSTDIIPTKFTLSKNINSIVSALMEGVDPKELKRFNIGNLVSNLAEPALANVPNRHVISIIEVDAKQKDPIRSATHPNYPYVLKGRGVGIVKDTVHIGRILPAAYGNAVSKLIKNYELKEDAKAAAPASVWSNALPAALNNTLFRNKPVSQADIEANKLIGWLQLAFPNTQFFTDPETWDAITNDPGVKKYIKNGDVVYGLTKDGKIYLNPSLMNSNTPIHEAGHIWLDVIENLEPELFNKGMKLAEDVSGDLGMSSKTTKDKKEILAKLIGDRGESIVNAAKKSKVKEWLLSVWNFVKSKLKSIRNLTTDQIENLTMNDFLDGALSDILGGEKAFDKKETSKVKGEPEFSKSSDSVDSAINQLSDAQDAGGAEVIKAQKEVTEKLGEEGKKIAEIDRNFDKLADDLGFIKTCII